MERVLENVRICLEKIRKKKNTFQVFVGFDGYVDTLVKPVRTMSGNGNMDFFSSISDFGAYIDKKAGRSCSIELHKIIEKVGGNAAIYASAVSNFGIHTKCVGAFGYPAVMDLFKQIGEGVELVSISNPGHCMALEFSDGKIMLSENEGINDLDYETIVERLGEDKLYRLIYESDVISLMNWSEVLGCTSIWKGILENILPKLPKDNRKKMFIDISDCSRRSVEDIWQMLQLLGEFSDYCDITLSLNKNEFEIICGVLGINSDVERLDETGAAVREACSVKYLVVHLVDGSYAFDEKFAYYADNRYVKQPLISTGGGDNFNAGLVYGIMIGMDIRSAMALANAASGYYVTNGRSATLEALIEYISGWQNERRAPA